MEEELITAHLLFRGLITCQISFELLVSQRPPTPHQTVLMAAEELLPPGCREKNYFSPSLLSDLAGGQSDISVLPDLITRLSWSNWPWEVSGEDSRKSWRLSAPWAISN